MSNKLVEIVRCRECFHNTSTGESWCDLYDMSVNGSDYCSWGQRYNERIEPMFCIDCKEYGEHWCYLKDTPVNEKDYCSLGEKNDKR